MECNAFSQWIVSSGVTVSPRLINDPHRTFEHILFGCPKCYQPGARCVMVLFQNVTNYMYFSLNFNLCLTCFIFTMNSNNFVPHVLVTYVRLHDSTEMLPILGHINPSASHVPINILTIKRHSNSYMFRIKWKRVFKLPGFVESFPGSVLFQFSHSLFRFDVVL